MNEWQEFNSAMQFGDAYDPVHTILRLKDTGDLAPRLQNIILKDVIFVKPEDVRVIFAALQYFSQSAEQYTKEQAEKIGGVDVIVESYKKDAALALEHVKLSAQQLINKYI